MVYFITYENLPQFVKIGYTDDMAQRVRQYSTYNPSPVVVLKTEDGGREEEKLFHKRFSQYRTNGEWFFLTNEIKDYIYADKLTRKAMSILPGKITELKGKSGYYVQVSVPNHLRKKTGRSALVKKAGNTIEEAMENEFSLVYEMLERIDKMEVNNMLGDYD